MAKIMGKLKHNYNAFPQLQTMFFHKHCVIWSFLPSFNELHHKLHIFKTSGTIPEQLTEEKSYNNRHLHLAFPNITRQVQS